MDWLTALESFIVGILSTLGTVLLVYRFFRPHIEFDKEIRARTHDPAPTQSQLQLLTGTVGSGLSSHESNGRQKYRYSVRYRNVGRVALMDLRVNVWIKVNAGRMDDNKQLRLVPVPTLGQTRSSLPAKRKKVSGVWQTPRLLLDQINWPQHLPPEKWPRQPLDLKSLLEELDGELHFHVIATTVGFQVTRVCQTTFRYSDLQTPDPELTKTNQETNSVD